MNDSADDLRLVTIMVAGKVYRGYVRHFTRESTEFDVTAFGCLETSRFVSGPQRMRLDFDILSQTDTTREAEQKISSVVEEVEAGARKIDFED